MCPNGSDDCNRVDVGPRQGLAEVRGHMHAGINLLDASQCRLVLVAHHGNFTPLHGAKIPDDLGSPITVADNTNSNHISSHDLVTCTVLTKFLRKLSTSLFQTDNARMKEVMKSCR